MSSILAGGVTHIAKAESLNSGFRLLFDTQYFRKAGNRTPMDTLLFLIHSLLLLLFGVYLSSSFAGITFIKKNVFRCLFTCFVCGLLQLAIYFRLGEDVVWKLYPLITHLPLFILLCFGFHKNWFSSICSICTAYLCCQPAKWFGVLAFSLWNHESIEYLVRIVVLLSVAVLILRFAASRLAEIFDNTNRGMIILGIIPIVYYIFDYISGIYTDFWLKYDRVALEFLPLFLCIMFLLFCVLYHNEYRNKAAAEHKEQLIRLTLEEQAKEIKAMERSSFEIRLLRHDLRLFLNNLSMCVENNDKETAQKLIRSYVDNVEATTVTKYCSNTTINYILSSFNAQCLARNISFVCQINLNTLNCDEIMLSTILSNALDNALNAQEKLPAKKRQIHLLLKSHCDKLLLSIKNPFGEPPIFQDGIPVSTKSNHGYGTKSIVYLTQKMGGHCQFKVQNGYLIFQLII